MIPELVELFRFVVDDATARLLRSVDNPRTKTLRAAPKGDGLGPRRRPRRSPTGRSRTAASVVVSGALPRAECAAPPGKPDATEAPVLPEVEELPPPVETFDDPPGGPLDLDDEPMPDDLEQPYAEIVDEDALELDEPSVETHTAKRAAEWRADLEQRRHERTLTHLPLFEPDEGERRDCALYRGCLDRFVARYPNLANREGAGRCPPSCSSFAPIPTHVRVGIAHAHGSRPTPTTL